MVEREPAHDLTMCGVAGFLGQPGADGELEALVVRMTEAVAARGPDAAGAWVDGSCGIGLGHRRLALLELTERGAQPMVSQGGRFVIVFNGEIYNHMEVRRELDGHPIAWRGHSDTETLIEAIAAWGIERTLERLVGMFAFAVWDRSGRILALARDRLGEKPLYYSWQGDTFLFGSTLSPLRRHPAFRAEIDRGAVKLLMRHNYVPAPWTIFEGVHKLEPGTCLFVRPNDRSERRLVYWSVREAMGAAAEDPFTGTLHEACDQLETLLRRAVQGALYADVPVGIFLSGGIDSSTVTALATQADAAPVHTYTVAYREARYSEAPHARAVAAHLGTLHQEMLVTEQEALEAVSELPALYDEPFADPAQIPLYLLARHTRKHVKVALSGDGGDELFGGYDRYVRYPRMWRQSRRVPALFRPPLSSALQGLAWVAGGKHAQKLHKVADIVGAGRREEIYQHIASLWKRPDDLVRGGTEPATAHANTDAWPDGLDFESQLMAFDMMTLLPDGYLTKTDRATMGAGLEARAPILDHRIVEFALRLPKDFKLSPAGGKLVLRELLYRHVPRALVDRKKMGFGVPLPIWLRGPLRPWAEALLDAGRLRAGGIFDERQVRARWQDLIRGSDWWAGPLWVVLTFQSWTEAWQRPDAA